MGKTYKIVVYVPVEHADNIRKVLGEAGAGRIGNYEFASFSSRGTGRFLPLKGARPTVGKIGILEEVDEERIEVVVKKKKLNEVLSDLKHAHPYETPAIEVIKLEDVQV